MSSTPAPHGTSNSFPRNLARLVPVNLPMKTNLFQVAPWAVALVATSLLAQQPAPQAGGEERPRREGREGGPGGPGGGGRGGMMRMLPVMQALDADSDGELSPAEISNATAALKKLDKNGDGKLDAEELRPAMGGRGGPGGPGGPGGGAANVSERVSQMMAMDKNGDGKLAADELPERMQGMINRADADKDGFVTKAELEALMSRQGQGRGPGGPGGEGGQGRRGRPGAE